MWPAIWSLSTSWFGPDLLAPPPVFHPSFRLRLIMFPGLSWDYTQTLASGISSKWWSHARLQTSHVSVDGLHPGTMSLKQIHSESCWIINPGCYGPGFRDLLTGDAYVSLLALLGSCSAPGHTLTPVILQPKDLLHLLAWDINLHLHHWETWRR